MCGSISTNKIPCTMPAFSLVSRGSLFLIGCCRFDSVYSESKEKEIVEKEYLGIREHTGHSLGTYTLTLSRRRDSRLQRTRFKCQAYSLCEVSENSYKCGLYLRARAQFPRASGEIRARHIIFCARAESFGARALYSARERRDSRSRIIYMYFRATKIRSRHLTVK